MNDLLVWTLSLGPFTDTVSGAARLKEEVIHLLWHHIHLIHLLNGWTGLLELIIESDSVTYGLAACYVLKPSMALSLSLVGVQPLRVFYLHLFVLSYFHSGFLLLSTNILHHILISTLSARPIALMHSFWTPNIGRVQLRLILSPRDTFLSVPVCVWQPVHKSTPLIGYMALARGLSHV